MYAHACLSPGPLCPTAMALGVLLSKLSQLPFSDIVLVSKKDPQLLELSREGVFEASKYLRSEGISQHWADEGEEGYESVFLKLLLPKAINHKKRVSNVTVRYLREINVRHARSRKTWSSDTLSFQT
jgi:hypothetical protein